MPISKKQKALLKAVREGEYYDIDELLNGYDSVDPNFPSMSDTTPLHEAVKTRNYEIVAILIGSGAQVNCRSKNGKTPLDVAENLYAHDICELLIEEGAKKARDLPKIRKKISSQKTMAAEVFTQSAGTESATSKKISFKAETLAEIFNAQKWINNTKEMQELWQKVPKRLQKKFDFAAALAETRQLAIKSHTPVKPIFKGPEALPPAP